MESQRDLSDVWPIGELRSTHPDWRAHVDAEPLLALLEELIMDLAAHDSGMKPEDFAHIIAEVAVG